jgi:predicted phosphodiesterase
MRILLVSDLHYALPQLDWVVRVSPDFDLVVVAGDTLSIRSAVPLEAQSVTVLQYFSLLQSVTRLAVSSGNHDLTGSRRQRGAVGAVARRSTGVGHPDRR